MNEQIKSGPDVSVVIGSYKRGRFLRRTLACVRRELEGLQGEIIVVDGGSGTGTLGWLMRQKDVVTIVQHNRGLWRGQRIERRSWGYFMNLGFKVAQGRYICMLSDDCLLEPGSLHRGIAHCEAERGRGRKVGAGAFYWHNSFGPKDYFVGLSYDGCVCVNHGLFLREAMKEVGLCDEERYQFYHGDTDLCLKMWEGGYEILDCPESFVEHFPHASAKVRAGNLASQERDMKAFVERWNPVFGGPDRQYEGGAKYVAHADPAGTKWRFPPLDIAALYVSRIVGHLRGVLGVNSREKGA